MRAASEEPATARRRPGKVASKKARFLSCDDDVVRQQDLILRVIFGDAFEVDGDDLLTVVGLSEDRRMSDGGGGIGSLRECDGTEDTERLPACMGNSPGWRTSPKT